ncbi:putative membrane protein YgcG [Methylobacterium sp. RAS18]|nr:putative membrane protein YgcG [Methylobacterium sp. RAS18]
MFGIFGRKRREEERRRREEQENRLRRARLLDAPSSPRSAANDSHMNPASSSGMVLSPLSPISPSYGGTDHAGPAHCSGSSSYSDSGSSCSSSDGGSGGGGGN